MSQLLETIKLKDGQLFNLEFHNNRLNEARKACFGECNDLNLSELISVPDDKKKGLFRCRVTYSKHIEEIEFIPHVYRSVKSLKLIVDNTIDYNYKYKNRDYLQLLFEQRSDADDILVVKNGFITDSFTANPIFFDGNKWWTPKTTLLNGTQREKLIGEGKIFCCEIRPKDVHKYQKVGLINALQDLENMPIISIENLIIH